MPSAATLGGCQGDLKGHQAHKLHDIKCPDMILSLRSVVTNMYVHISALFCFVYLFMTLQKLK